MKYDMGPWEIGKAILITRLEAGAWPHGITTEAAMKEMARYAKQPFDINVMLLPKWKNKDGALRLVGLYYFTQASLKNEYYIFTGDSGDTYRLRCFYCVPHGWVEGELDEKGKPRKPPRTGLWLRDEDMNPRDVRGLAKRYHVRATDSAPVKKYIWTAQEKAEGRPEDITMADIMDEIRASM